MKSSAETGMNVIKKPKHIECNDIHKKKKKKLADKY